MDCSAANHLPQGVTTLVCLNGTGFPQWVGPLVALIGAAVAAYIALQSIDNAKALARRKATLDLIEKTESAEHYQRLAEAFTEVRKADSFAYLVDPSDEASKKTRGQVIDYLNHYELVAIGVDHQILDAGIYRAWMQSAFIRDWNAAAGWIQALRLGVGEDGRPSYNSNAYANYQRVAREWSTDGAWRQQPARRGPVAILLTAADAPLRHVDAPPPILPSDSEPV